MKNYVNKIKYGSILLLILFIIFFTIIKNSTVKAAETFSVGQIPYINFFCKDEKSMLAIAEADVSSYQQSNLVVKMLVQSGQCIFSPYPIQIEIVSIVMDYVDYQKKKVQVVKGKIKDTFVYSGLYAYQAKNVPFKNNEKKI